MFCPVSLPLFHLINSANFIAILFSICFQARNVDNSANCIALLLLICFQARNVDKKDLLGKSDPFIRVYKKGDQGANNYILVHSTEVNHSFVFPFTYDWCHAKPTADGMKFINFTCLKIEQNHTSSCSLLILIYESILRFS